MKIRFVVDSACDVPKNYIDKYEMTVAPAFVNYNGNSYADDGVDFSRKDYYNQLSQIKPLPKTAALSPGLAKEIIHRAYDKTDHLVLVSISSKLSSLHNALRLGAADLPPENVTLIDSYHLSMGAGYQAIIGAEVAQKTGDINAVKQAIQQAQSSIFVYAATPTVEYLQQGGRVSWAAGAIGSFLRIRPIVEVTDGEVKPIALARKRNAWLDKVAAFARRHAPLQRLAFLHSNADEDIAALRERIADIVPEDTLTTLITPSIGTHTGPNSIGVALVSKT